MLMLPTILAFWSLLSAAAAEPPPCRGNPALAGKCFTVRGRLRAYNGNPTFRLWPARTTRLIGITGAVPGDPPILPADLTCGFSCDIFADFEVCPFTTSAPSVMQRACIESATHKTIQHQHHAQD